MDFFSIRVKRKLLIYALKPHLVIWGSATSATSLLALNMGMEGCAVPCSSMSALLFLYLFNFDPLFPHMIIVARAYVFMYCIFLVLYLSWLSIFWVLGCFKSIRSIHSERFLYVYHTFCGCVFQVQQRMNEMLTVNFCLFDFSVTNFSQSSCANLDFLFTASLHW